MSADALATQIASSAKAMSDATAPAEIVRVRSRVEASIREIVCSPVLSVHTAPPPLTIVVGVVPTGITATTLVVGGVDHGDGVRGRDGRGEPGACAQVDRHSEDRNRNECRCSGWKSSTAQWERRPTICVGERLEALEGWKIVAEALSEQLVNLHGLREILQLMASNEP